MPRSTVVSRSASYATPSSGVPLIRGGPVMDVVLEAAARAAVHGSKILMSLGRANHVVVIDGATLEVIKYILVGRRAWSVDLSPDESVAIVSNGLSDDITVVDMVSLEATQTIPVGRVPHTVMIDG